MYQQIKQQYIEIIFRIIELSHVSGDLMKEFRRFKSREITHIPGGFHPESFHDRGGPHFQDKQKQLWYNRLYYLLVDLYKNKYRPEKILDSHLYTNWNHLSIKHCDKCGKLRIHEISIEQAIAAYFYIHHFAAFINENRWEDFFDSSKTFEHPDVMNFRNQLMTELEKREVKITYFKEGNLAKCLSECEDDPRSWKYFNVKLEPHFHLEAKTI